MGSTVMAQLPSADPCSIITQNTGQPATDGSGTDTAPPFLLPDLQTLPPTDLYIQIPSRGQRLLRMANTAWNSGQGRLEVIGELNPETKQTIVRQRLYTADGSFQECAVGEFVWHPEHNHFHFTDFALYQLWSLTPSGEPDQVVSTSSKLSYCLMDNYVVDRNNPSFTWRRRYYGCSRTLQGMSAGWGDKYEAYLEGQSLDITGLPDGVYCLVSVTNPIPRVVESDYTNNTAVIYVRIVRYRVTVVPPPALE
ncbi:MAG: lysyl oxidase family protein [Chloroflexi bacterium]|nr:lysyl oxidase family protein [Chloroflexota bacterium]